ncbi:MAG: tRNA (uridine(34)/cytosine(34)/5-carboxymethylaminomethyluridine(34)-2'-O)-methyltransferase TrmL [Fervidicoccus fontis]|uniref:Putative tRNA (cytidine(34)-2'-O)-methyltransferase n=1 Tax=Thermodesulfobium acidiphilum TaxID=1794699 RepID=A0A2R4VYA1_THEAF|nr:tRNA (cytidine(34)-2'-O)-methyltransferase [Thermodesulfobium acidiphilum]AWB09521.1 tRNA (cytidine/uridine-2'-O-)-methyltransferase [Thermodesulfobium acidiphilum]PMB77819.1 MAG: tRNA (uridine(34)/cytosine(34)/5-carboxymethylaminomethyluridine(34)-2'-O)-methyltransferase TrmL [Fervidicoccus fontis]HEM56305.1 tRNA (cytidine(34)-2'-O)-methyltransferase [Thermodesulfobium narugense]
MKVVLVEPEIPQNTGNIGRLCVAAGVSLVIVGPTGFILNDKRLKRAGMDYWKYLDFTFYPTFDEARDDFDLKNIFLFTPSGKNVYTKGRYSKESILIFGKESSGLDEKILQEFEEKTYYIPMKKQARSLNLANSVAIVLYEALRQIENW